MKCVRVTIIAICWWQALCVLAASQAAGPLRELNPLRAHVSLYLTEAPDLRFYARRDLTGPPEIVVNDLGAFVGKTLVCPWPGGRYDVSDRANMVLGYATRLDIDSGKYTPCPDGFPVISTWGDHGKGAAALYIEVFTRNRSLVEVRFRGKPYFVDLNALPGDPRPQLEVAGSSFIAAPSLPLFGVKPKGFVGWEWEIPEVEATRLRASATARLRRQPEFAQFLKSAQACLSSSRVPACFVPFVDEILANPEIEPRVYNVAAADFVDAVWRQANQDGRRRWADLRECFFSQDLDPGIDRARLMTNQGWVCDLALTRNGWKLTGFFLAP